MPVVDKNQLKIWFKNLAKPVQEQFWNWMDSFYHKSEPIPKSAVENLTTDLAKKADLVGGVVPASQLPFTVNASEVIAVGEISATENTVTLAVHSSGTNVVRINGVVLTRSFPNTFNFTPVTDGSKFLILYAVNDSGIFRLAEGVEDLEAVEPELPTGALFVRRILINSAGADIELPSLTGFKEKIEDNWKVYTFYEALAPKVLPFNVDKSCSFLVQNTEGLTGDLHLGGIKVNETSLNNWWSGKEFTIKNNTANNLILLAAANYSGLGMKFNLSENLTLSAGKSIKVKVSLDASILEVLQFSSPVDLSTKQDRLQDVTGNIGLGKSDASATEKLDIAGRTKSDGIFINETTSAIIPREIKFKSGNFVAAGNDGVEKKLLREGDAITLPTPFKYGYGNGNVTSNNVFGIEALNSNTTGANNAAFGRSLVLNTTGSNNSAFGSNACLYYNTTGNSNCAFGYSALMNNSTASFNTAFGSEALLNSNANYNSAFGYQTLRLNTSGTSNMGFGAFSLSSNTTGSNNTGVGQGTLSKNTTASKNTAIGTGAGSELNTGGSNVCIGAWAGTYNASLGNINSYSNCTYIGEFSRASANGVTNEIAIGKDSKGQGSNTATIGNENTDTLHLLKNGAGIVLISPDGTKKVKISIDNSGNLITTLIV